MDISGAGRNSFTSGFRLSQLFNVFGDGTGRRGKLQLMYVAASQDGALATSGQCWGLLQVEAIEVSSALIVRFSQPAKPQFRMVNRARGSVCFRQAVMKQTTQTTHAVSELRASRIDSFTSNHFNHMLFLVFLIVVLHITLIIGGLRLGTALLPEARGGLALRLVLSTLLPFRSRGPRECEKQSRSVAGSCA